MYFPEMFQCPLSGQLCCCKMLEQAAAALKVSMPFKRAVVLLSRPVPNRFLSQLVSMPFKRAVVLLSVATSPAEKARAVSMPFKRAVVLL